MSGTTSQPVITGFYVQPNLLAGDAGRIYFPDDFEGG